MKILLLGDYSNVHATLAKGLRTLGHRVTLASDGDSWKNYPRDIDLARSPMTFWRGGKRRKWIARNIEKMVYQLRLLYYFFQFRGYDVVQLINPIFLPLQAQRIWPYYQWLRKRNKKVFLGAFGMDHYYVKSCEDCKTFRYSDFNLGTHLRDREDCKIWSREWGEGEKGRLNQLLVQDVDGIVAGLYEYWASYMKEYAHKLTYIPFPIVSLKGRQNVEEDKVKFKNRPLRFFVGIQRKRHTYKGTDILLQVLERLKEERPSEVEVMIAENVPFESYKEMLLSADILLDQIYSYTPAMNALQAMSSGVVVVSGAEPEFYALQGCRDLRPIINVLPQEEDVYEKLSWILNHKEEVLELKRQSLLYIERYHDHLTVAKQYLDFWTKQ